MWEPSDATPDKSQMNVAGIPRDELISYLRSPERMRRAVQRGLCLLCCDTPVNEVCLCPSCFPCLTDEERRFAEPYLSAGSF